MDDNIFTDGGMTGTHQHTDTVRNVEGRGVDLHGIFVCDIDAAGNIAGSGNIGIEHTAVDRDVTPFLVRRTVGSNYAIVL